MHKERLLRKDWVNKLKGKGRLARGFYTKNLIRRFVSIILNHSLYDLVRLASDIDHSILIMLNYDIGEFRS